MSHLAEEIIDYSGCDNPINYYLLCYPVEGHYYYYYYYYCLEREREREREIDYLILLYHTPRMVADKVRVIRITEMRPTLL